MARAIDILCAIIGHDRRYLQTQYIRHGRKRTGSRCFCTRCGSGDSVQLHREGILEYLQSFRYHLRETFRPLRSWLGERCIDCGKPCRRLGKPAGDHDRCLPF